MIVFSKYTVKGTTTSSETALEDKKAFSGMKKDDFEEIKAKTYIDCDDIIAEYVDKIECNNGETYTNSLIICNSDYCICLIIPMELTPQNLKNYITD